MCLACQHFDFNSTDCDHQLIFANNGKGIHLSVQETSVGQERVTNPKERLRGTIEGLGTRFVKVSARQQATRSNSSNTLNVSFGKQHQWLSINILSSNSQVFLQLSDA